MSASEDMNEALSRLLLQDRVPPCGEKYAPDPCSEDARERAEAARRCSACLIAQECAALGSEIKADAHVWAGRDLTRTLGRKPKGAAA